MTVDITQDEMNILNLNGISADEIRSNVEYMRATGLDDAAIRKQYTDTINELKPLTKQSYNDTGKIKEWQAKGGITPFEYANKRAVEFNGTYDNVISHEQSRQEYLDAHPKAKAWSNSVDERIARNAQAKAERDKRVNEGTASFLDRAGAALDRWGNESYQAQVNAPDDIVVKMSGVNNPVDKTGKINFTEALGNSFMTGEWIPFLGGFIKGADDKKEREIREHILNGEPIRQDELNYLNHRLEEKQEEAVRGYTWGGNVANGFLPSLIRFGGEIYTGGWVLKGLGLVSEASAGASLGTKALNAAGNMGKYGAAGVLLPTGWNDTYQNYQERLLNNGFEFTDKGSYIFKESDEKPAISFLKSLGQTFVMFASEASGELLNIPVQGAMSAISKYAGTPISKYLMSQPKITGFVNKVLPELSKYYEKLNKLKPKGDAYEFLKDSVKFDGFLEEMGEEVVEDVLNLTLGTTDEKRTLENYAKAVFKSPDEWAIIAGAIALQGGTLSVASHTLGSYMERNGASQEEILEVMQNLSETEKEQKISELATEGLIDVSNYSNSELDARAELKNKYFTQLKNAGKVDDEAIQEASLMSEIIADSAKRWGISLDDAEKKFAITLQNMTDEQAIKQWQSDNSTTLQGRVIFNANEAIENKLNQIYEEYDKLPEDFNDMNVINKYIDDMQTLESIKDGTIEDTEKAQNLINEYEQSDPDLARALKDAMQGGVKLHKQSIDKDNIEKNFGDTTENITENIKADILNILEENGLDESEFNFEDIRVYGSYSTGKNKETSDLDFIVQYSGSMREDDAFNMLNDEKLTIEDVNGRTVEIDINPINVEKSGTIDENLKYFDSLQPKFQSIESAGAENNQTALAKQEWKKKGTESKFFKKWFGNSKVSDWQGNPIVVYHGTENNFKIFKNTGKSRQIGANVGFFFTSDKEMAKQYADDKRVMPVYLSLQNPLIIDENSTVKIFNQNINIKDAFDFFTQLGNIKSEQEIKEELIKLGYDGIVLNNTNVDTRSYENLHDVYVAFYPEQIKSVNNQGTFDENNPNIYFQRKRVEAPGQMKLFQDAIQMNLFQQKTIFKTEKENGQNIETEIKEQYTKKDIQETKQESTGINDVGDSLLGNLKKNKKQYTWQELEEMNELLRKKYLSKNYIYQLNSYEELKKQGLSDKCIAFINNVYSKINAKPAKGYESMSEQKIYFDFVHEVMEKTINFTKENQDIIDKHNMGTDNSLFKIVFPDTENKKAYNIFRAYPEYNKKAIIAGGNKLIGALYLDYHTEKDIKKILLKLNKNDEVTEEKKETLTGWQKFFDVSQSYRGWFVADKKSGMVLSTKELPSKEIAQELAQKMYDFLSENKKGYEVDFSNLRNYIPRRKDNQNVNPEALIEVFGFRGINFGNWTKQNERQNFVNLAYDSLYDLAEILNLPPKALSLGGKLGLAFGAQGRSSAAGHFIPEYNEINLTRKSGAGSLAHEWWHALDYYFGDQSENKDFSGKDSLSLKQQGFLRDEIYAALQTINEQIKYAPLTEKDLEEKKNIYSERIKNGINYCVKDIKNSFAKSKNIEAINSFIKNIVDNAETINLKDGNFDALTKQFNELLDERRRTFDNLNKLYQLLYQVKRLQQVEDMAKSSRKYTDYYTKAEKLNTIEKGHGMGYWTRNTELGARAFASYILDKMNQKTMQNNFLVRDESLEYSFDMSIVSEILNAKMNQKESDKNMQDSIIQWYPAEPEERKRIFAAFDNLFKKTKTREENNRLILFQSMDNENLRSDIENARGFTYQRFNFDGTVKDNLITLLNNKADKSTLIHEFAHVYLTTLTNMARENERAKSMLLTVNKWLRYDGIEYTTAQHEKFANGFVAYVRSGKAPTYGLKLAFENFRKWLNDLYNTITNNDDLFLDQETEKVFEELLGDISINAQKKAANDIIDRAKRYAEIRFNDEGLKNEIDQNKLTDTQRRYRDTAYDIMYYALSHSKKAKNFVKDRQQLVMILGNRNKAVGKRNMGIKVQAERIYEILSELDDEFSANDGFLPEWAEFFNDPGVSYDNQETGADAELAMEAYRVITEERYLYAPGEDFSEFGILTDEEVQKNEYELEFILNEYRDAEDKTIPLFAYYEWQDNLHPYIQEDFAKKWEAQSNEIDRYQALSKFDQAKEDLKIYAATLKGHGDYSTQFADYARAILKRLDFMTELDKARIFDKLKEFNSFREIERNLDDVMDYAETIAAVSERKQLANDIDREIKQTIHEWKNGIKKTKYTYPANKLFTRLREISKMKQEQVQDLYDELANDEGEITYEADAVNNEDYYVTIEKMFITFKANGSYYNSTEFLTDLLNRIQGAKFSAKLARDEIDFERRMAQINLIDECARAVDEHKGKVSGLEKAYRHAFNLNSALEMMFNKSIKSKFSLDYLYAQRDAKVGKDRNEVLEKLAHVYGFNGKFRDIQLFNKFIDMTKKEFKIKQRYTPDKVNGTYRITHTDKESGRTFTDRVINLLKRDNYKEWEDEPIELSRMELLYYYIQAKNPISYNMLTHMGDETTPAKGQFDKFEFDSLLENLTDQEKLMGDILQMAAEKYYPELNKYHIKKYHVDLGKVSCYFPRKSETQDVKMLEMFNQYAQLNTNQKFQKQRTAGAGVRIAPANPLAVLFDHIEKSNTLIIMGEQLDLMNSVFKDADLSRKIKAVWGDETAKEFMQQITSNLYGGQMSTISEAESFIGSISNNVIKSQIFLKPQVGLKQVISFMNYGVGDDYVTPAEWMKKFAAQAFTPQEWKNNIKYMMNIPYLKDRFSRGGSTDALKRQLEQRLFAKISLFDDILSANVRYGDIGAIILGGKPYIDCLLDKGYTEEQAIKIFIEKTVNDQQSSIPSTLSNIQRNAARQPLAKMFFAYQNTPWQYFRTASNAIIRFKQNPNKQTGMNMAKLVSLYLFVFPLIFNMASSLSPLIFATGGGDDDLKADFWKSIIGGITFIPLAGMFINTIYSGFRGEKASTGNWFDTAAGKMGKTARHISKGEVTPLDIFQAIALFGEASTGLPLTTAGTELSGAWNILTGELAKGAIKMSGYTDYRAKKVTGQED